MNYGIFLIKIIKKPQQNCFDGEITVTEIIGEFYPTQNSTFETKITLLIWGNSTYDTVKYYKENDYIIVEGYLSLRNPLCENTGQTSYKQIEISSFKVYPIF
tara:strand:- start:1495 stop:1800 length:306 start_codon:yes stop_codon:yes gene_type:complete